MGLEPAVIGMSTISGAANDEGVLSSFHSFGWRGFEKAFEKRLPGAGRRNRSNGSQSLGKQAAIHDINAFVSKASFRQ
jgi:hypothetical protein